MGDTHTCAPVLGSVLHGGSASSPNCLADGATRFAEDCVPIKAVWPKISFSSACACFVLICIFGETLRCAEEYKSQIRPAGLPIEQCFAPGSSRQTWGAEQYRLNQSNRPSPRRLSNTSHERCGHCAINWGAARFKPSDRLLACDTDLAQGWVTG